MGIRDRSERVRIDDGRTGAIPFRYVGVVHLNRRADFKNRDTKTEEYAAFTAKMNSLTSEIHATFGTQIH